VIDRRNGQEVVRYYYRVGKGPRTSLVGLPYTDEFMVSYQAAAEGRTGVAMPALARRSTEVRTLSTLIAHYRGNNEQFKRNRDGTTKKGYGSRLRAIDRDYGIARWSASRANVSSTSLRTSTTGPVQVSTPTRSSKS
jgi:hypothetical protein